MLLVVTHLFGDRESWDIPSETEELTDLVLSTGCSVVGVVTAKLDTVHPASYIGKGKVLEIAERCKALSANLIIFNHNLSFTQERNIEDVTSVRVIDRTQLILDIFARHAASSQGKLQVELAQLEYLLPRLKGKGIMLSRLGGGIGTRGPGEKKLELDRRRISDRIALLKSELERLKVQRKVSKAKRARRKIPLVALVGYTSCGKSTLLNALTGSTQITSRHLFTTLDPLNRVWKVNERFQVILADTVGFIHNLPEKLFDSFRATLDELDDASGLIHVVDIAKARFEQLIASTEKILKKLSCQKETILVFNKKDKVENGICEHVRMKYPKALFLSALQKEGLDALRERIGTLMEFESMVCRVEFPLERGDIVRLLYSRARVLEFSAESKFCAKVILDENTEKHLKSLGAIVMKND